MYSRSREAIWTFLEDHRSSRAARYYGNAKAFYYYYYYYHYYSRSSSSSSSKRPRFGSVRFDLHLDGSRSSQKERFARIVVRAVRAVLEKKQFARFVRQMLR